MPTPTHHSSLDQEMDSLPGYYFYNMTRCQEPPTSTEATNLSYLKAELKKRATLYNSVNAAFSRLCQLGAVRAVRNSSPHRWVATKTGERAFRKACSRNGWRPPEKMILVGTPWPSTLEKEIRNADKLSRTARQILESPVIKVRVTAKHIADGVPLDSGRCMIKEAIKEVVPHGVNFAIDTSTIRWSDPNKRLRYAYITPKPARVALVAFDQAIMPQPFGFVLKDAQVVRMAIRIRGKSIPVRDKAIILQRTARDVKKQTSPVIFGGQLPPTIPLSRRREFGMRGLLQPLREAGIAPMRATSK